MNTNSIDPKNQREPTKLESCLSLLMRSLPIKHGTHRILDWVRSTSWVNDPSLVKLPYKGYTILMDVSDLVGWHFFIMHNFDPEVTEIIERFSVGDENDVFWDIGANKGACSYEIASALNMCRIVAIEPQYEMRELLESNLQTLAPGRHEIFSVGIGEVPGHFDIVIPNGNRGQASLIVNKINDGNLIEAIEVVTAVTLEKQSQYGWPTIIKIDVEGFEPSVIKSLEPAFECRRVRCCVFECHSTEATGFENIRNTTEKFGYHIYAIQKTIFTTTLTPTLALVKDATDYAIIRDDLFERC